MLCSVGDCVRLGFGPMIHGGSGSVRGAFYGRHPSTNIIFPMCGRGDGNFPPSPLQVDVHVSKIISPHGRMLDRAGKQDERLVNPRGALHSCLKLRREPICRCVCVVEHSTMGSRTLCTTRALVIVCA